MITAMIAYSAQKPLRESSKRMEKHLCQRGCKQTGDRITQPKSAIPTDTAAVVESSRFRVRAISVMIMFLIMVAYCYADCYDHWQSF